MFSRLRPQVATLLQEHDKSVEDRLQQVCELLQTEVPHYNWVGFYFRDPSKEELLLGPFAGEPTEHTRIPFGKGICGQVALTGKNFVVPDVSAQDNYIACSLNVRAEIVVPLFVHGKNVGQIDIDSHSPDPFGEEDERFLESINAEVARIMEN